MTHDSFFNPISLHIGFGTNERTRGGLYVTVSRSQSTFIFSPRPYLSFVLQIVTFNREVKYPLLYVSGYHRRPRIC